MSIVIKSRQLDVKDNDGTYHGINAVAEKTSADIVADLNTTKTTIEAAITAKGQQTIASIPSDYTTLSNEVGAVKEDLAQYRKTHTVAYDINLYSVNNIVHGYWITGEGNKNALNTCDIASIPVVGGNDVVLCYGTGGNASNMMGGINLLDVNGDVIATKKIEDIKNGETRGDGYAVGTFFVPENVVCIELTLKLVTTWNATNTLIVAYGKSLAEFTGDGKVISSWDGFVFDDYGAKAEVQKINDMLVYTSGKNLNNKAEEEDGYIDDKGIIHKYADWRSTSFLDVRGVEHITASAYGYRTTHTRYKIPMYFVCVYDNDKNFIKQTANTISEQTGYTVEDGVAYVRFAYKSNDINDIQVESGYYATDYEEYKLLVAFKESPYNKTAQAWKGKKWVVLGDSLTEHNQRTNMNYHDYIAEATGIKVVNMGRSGTGYKRTEDEGFAFYQRVVNIPTDCDVLTIFGSGNDLGGGFTLGTPTDTETDTICGCINKTIDTIIGIKPNVSLGIVSPTPWDGQNPANDNCAMARYSAALKQICYNRSIPFLDLYHCSNLRPWTAEGKAACYTKDDGNGVHPDETGHKLISARFKAFLDTLIV